MPVSQAGARRRSAASCAASVFPVFSNIPAACRARARPSGFPAARRSWSASACIRPDKAMPRSSPPAGGAARHRARSSSPIHGDSDSISPGSASVGSRSTMTAGQRHRRAADVLLRRAGVAADVLEAAEADIEFRDGAFNVAGTDRRITLFELAERPRSSRRAARSPKTSTQRLSPRRRRPFRMAATSPRSRSIRRPASSRSSPIRRSMIAARRSTP